MIHSYISSSVLVGEVYINYGIKSSAWESNAALWLYHALGDIGINRFTIDRNPTLVEFTEGRFMLPAESTLVKKIHFFEMDTRPNVKDYDKELINGEKLVPFSQKGTWIHIQNLEKGYALVKYKSLPASYDKNIGQSFPIIPDDEPLKKALRIYLLMQILMTGYIHPVYNLTVNNIWTNPTFLYEKQLKSARNSVNRMDAIDYHKISSMISTFITPRLTKSFYLNDINR